MSFPLKKSKILQNQFSNQYKRSLKPLKHSLNQNFFKKYKEASMFSKKQFKIAQLTSR